MTTIQGRKLLIIRRLLLRKLFKGGKYSREETIHGNTVHQVLIYSWINEKPFEQIIVFTTF